MRRLLIAALALLATTGLGCGESEEATAKVPPTFFGIAPQDAVNDADLARMDRGNVGSYHLLLSWARTETSERSYDWTKYDFLIGTLATYGIEPITYVFGTPDWVAKAEDIPPVGNQKQMSAYKAFLAAAVQRYGPDGAFWDQFALTNPGVEPRPIRIWEIWNEVNSSNFWAPKPDPGDYAKLLRASAKTLKKWDPGAQIMVAGMFATPQSKNALTSFEYLHKLYAKKGVADATDLVAAHPYGPRIKDVRKQLDKTYKQMKKGGDGGDGIWVTEIGWGSDPKIRSQLATTPAKQAKLLTKAYRMMIAKRNRWNLQGALWYTWRDSKNPESLVCGWCGSAGLVDSDLDTKPAWRAFTTLTGGSPG